MTLIKTAMVSSANEPQINIYFTFKSQKSPNVNIEQQH